MAKRDTTKLETAAGEQTVGKSKFEVAKEELRKAEQAYHELVRQDTAGMPEAQKQEHQQACQAALQTKREVWQIVEDIKMGKV